MVRRGSAVRVGKRASSFFARSASPSRPNDSASAHTARTSTASRAARITATGSTAPSGIPLVEQVRVRVQGDVGRVAHLASDVNDRDALLDEQRRERVP
jgi:hypothetical protein